jgi:phosphatidylglycerol lysyltransferase
VTTISPLALAHGKESFVCGESRIAYRRLPGLWLALGGPQGPREEAVAAMTVFAQGARDHGVGYGLAPVEASAAACHAIRRAGSRVLPVGDVARVRVGSFHLLGNRRRKLRQSRNGLRRAGWRFHLYDPPHPTSLLDALETVSRTWLRGKRVRENTFGMGWFDRGYLGQCPLAVARDERGTPAGFVSLFGDATGELSVDLMRYAPGSPHGVMDFLFVSLLEALEEQGCPMLNLGLAPLTGPQVERAEGWPGWVMRRLARHRAWYDCRGLRAFKAKFGPEWTPAQLVYSSPAALPAIFLAVTRPVPRIGPARTTDERFACLEVLDKCLNDCGLLVKPTAPPVLPDWSPVNERHN